VGFISIGAILDFAWVLVHRRTQKDESDLTDNPVSKNLPKDVGCPKNHAGLTLFTGL
jgi:hypothetical protein